MKSKGFAGKVTRSLLLGCDIPPMIIILGSLYLLLHFVGGAAATTGSSAVQPESNWNRNAEKSLSLAGFSEADIEFMKKAIQVLC